MDTKSDKFSYGIILLIYGVLFFLDKSSILDKIPYASNLISFGGFFLVAAIVFIISQPKKMLGWIFLGITILLNAGLIFSQITAYSNYILPLALLIAGGAMLLSSKK